MTRQTAIVEVSGAPPTPDSTLRKEPSGANDMSELAARLQDYQRSCEARAAKLDELWGPEPAYESQAEDKASVFVGKFFYSWIGDFMYRAAKEEMKSEDLPRPTRSYRAYNVGRELSEEMQRQRRCEHAWDCLCGGDVRVRHTGRPAKSFGQKLKSLVLQPCFGAKTDAYGSCVPIGATGTLRWVGNPQQYGRQRQRFVGVEWDEASSWASVKGTATAPVQTSQLENTEQARPAPGELHNGTVGGEELFQTASGGQTATCEPVENIAFVTPLPQLLDGTDADKSQWQRHPPRGMSVAFGLLHSLGRFLWSAWRTRIGRDSCTVLLPLVLKFYIQLIEKVSKEEKAEWGRGFLLVFIILLVSVVQNICSNKYFHIAFRSAYAYRSALSGIVFEKCMSIADRALALPAMNPGRITNMVSNDCEKVFMFCVNTWTMFGAMVQLCAAVTMLYFLLGPAVFVGLVVLLISAPLQYIMTKMVFAAFDEKADATDARLKATNEFIAGIRVTKFMSWEPSFVINIERKRRLELQKIKKIQTLFVFSNFMDSGLPNLSIAIMLLVYSLQGNMITAATVFPAISLLNVLSMPFFCIPMFISACTQYFVSTNRITRFVECPDTDSKVVELVDNMNAELEHEEGEHNKHPGQPESDAYMRKRYAALFESAGLSAYMAEALPVYETAAERVRREKEKARRQAKRAKKKGAESKPDPEDEYLMYQLRPKELMHEVNLKIPRGKLTVIVGPTGSGKSTLLDSLIGAVDVTSGRVLAARSVAYVPQQAWIMNATLRENVLFFSEHERERFERALDCSQLRADLSLLADGLETEIGEKGINLSGGQKARVGLARAVYADKELYLLDDPLSALDAHVGERVMQECVLGALSGKTRVLATHQTQFAAHADYIAVLGTNGRILFQGDAAAYSVYEDMNNELPAPSLSMPHSASSLVIDMGSPTMSKTSRAQQKLVNQDIRDEGEIENEAKLEGEGEKAANKLVEAEEMAEGSVPLAIYKRYAQACGGVTYWVAVLVTHVITECLAVAPSLWLSLWSTNALHLNSDDGSHTSPVYIYTYMILTVAGVCSTPVRRSILYPVMRAGSRSMHSALLRSVASATMQFFDTTPLGRIVNRFSKDLDMLDFSLSDDMCFFLQNVFTALSSLSVMVFTQPAVMIVLAPASYIYYRLSLFFTAANRTIRRYENVATAPVVAMVTTIVNGRWTIEAYRAGPQMLQKALEHLDNLFSARYLETIGERWLMVRVTMLSASISFSIALFGAISVNWAASKAGGNGSTGGDGGGGSGSSSTQVGLISLSLTMALNFNMIFTDLIDNAAHIESDMNSVERLIHYTDSIPHEDLQNSLNAAIDENEARVEKLMEQDDKAVEEAAVREAATDVIISAPSSPAEQTPSSFSPTTRREIAKVEEELQHAAVPAGSLEFRHVDMRYRPGLPLVLRDVSFRIEPRQKVGVVGRTGSGKSTLLLAFLRLVEVCGGEMVVCGRAAGTYDVRSLRRLFSMIPQDPLLFDGTVRSNIDPFGEASDAECWAALAHVGMAARVRGETGGLGGRVAEGGSNFSVGQRQLLCLARALLRRGSAFLLMDEATANVDPALDRQIQQTVARTFHEYTVITIAHRLHTVAGYDRILMMEEGRVVAFGSPRALVSDASSPFAELVRSMSEEAQRKFVKSMK